MTTEPQTTAPAGPQPHRSGPFWTVIDFLTTANTVMVTILSVLLALLVGAVLIIISTPSVLGEWGFFFAEPGTVLSDSWTLIGDAYANLFKGAVVDPAAIGAAVNGSGAWSQVFASISETFVYAAPLIFAGLAVALAFRGGLFNIGAQGQAIMGAVGGGLVGFGIRAPGGLHLLLALAGAVVGGAIWGGLAGLLKARTGAHEVIVTIMLNYIALLFLNWIIIVHGVHDPTRIDAISKKVDSTARLPLLGGSGLRWNLGIILGVLAVAGVAWLINRSTVGFELRAVGSNPSAARTAGMSVARTYLLVMLISGALGGLAGGVQLLGTAYSLTGGVTGTVGFDGITVALLGRGKPWGVLASALLFGALRAGGNRMQSYSGVAVDLVTVIQAVIVIFIAAPLLVKQIFRLRTPRSGLSGGFLAKGW